MPKAQIKIDGLVEIYLACGVALVQRLRMKELSRTLSRLPVSVLTK